MNTTKEKTQHAVEWTKEKLGLTSDTYLNLGSTVDYYEKALRGGLLNPCWRINEEIFMIAAEVMEE